MATNNATILDRIWLSGTNDYQQRIPVTTQSGISATIDALTDPMNKQYWNQFVDSLIMRVGDVFVHGDTWRNRLAFMKKSRLEYGSTIQEMVPHWISAHSYVDNAEDVFKMARPDVSTWYHSQNRRDRYDITVNDRELKTAFDSSYGLNNLVAKIMQVPMNSDEYDEYRIMMQLMAVFENKWGFYKENLSAAVTTKAIGEDFLVSVRKYAELLQFPSSLYHSGEADVPVFVNPRELVLFMTPDVKANVDVRNYAAAFNRSDEEIQSRIVVVDEFPIAGAQALLTTEDFFMCKDTEYQTTSAYNPKSLGTNYFLHHWGIYSVSPFVPAILFTTESATVPSIVTQTVTGMTATIADSTPNVGDDVQITISLTGSLAASSGTVPAIIAVAPDAATYSVSIVDSDSAAVIDPTTYVDNYGILHVGDELSSGDVITVVCTSTYVNPSGSTTEYTATVTATVA